MGPFQTCVVPFWLVSISLWHVSAPCLEPWLPLVERALRVLLANWSLLLLVPYVMFKETDWTRIKLICIIILQMCMHLHSSSASSFLSQRNRCPSVLLVSPLSEQAVSNLLPPTILSATFSVGESEMASIASLSPVFSPKLDWKLFESRTVSYSLWVPHSADLLPAACHPLGVQPTT